MNLRKALGVTLSGYAGVLLPPPLTKAAVAWVDRVTALSFSARPPIRFITLSNCELRSNLKLARD